MPTYLIHGFRWLRHSIRIHIILNDLEDAAAEWIVAPATSLTLLNSFYTSFDFLPRSQFPSLSHTSSVSTKQPASNGTQLPRVTGPGGQEGKGTKQSGGFKKTLKRMSSAVRLRGNTNTNANPLRNGDNSSVNEDAPPPMPNAIPSTLTPSYTSSPNLHTQSSKPPPFNDWSNVKFLEQYDPDDTEVVSQPYAYVADHVACISLGASIEEEMLRYQAKVMEADTSSRSSKPTRKDSSSTRTASVEAHRVKQNPWFEKLRDGLQKDAQIGWFVVVCGDEERAAPTPSDWGSVVSDEVDERESQKTPTKTGLRRFFPKKNSQEA